MKVGKVIREHKKLAEECLELALIITQQLNKSKVDFEDEIIEEIGDVKWRLEQVEKYYSSERIEERIQYKKNRESSKELELNDNSNESDEMDDSSRFPIKQRRMEEFGYRKVYGDELKKYMKDKKK